MSYFAFDIYSYKSVKDGGEEAKKVLYGINNKH